MKKLIIVISCLLASCATIAPIKEYPKEVIAKSNLRITNDWKYAESRPIIIQIKGADIKDTFRAGETLFYTLPVGHYSVQAKLDVWDGTQDKIEIDIVSDRVVHLSAYYAHFLFYGGVALEQR